MGDRSQLSARRHSPRPLPQLAICSTEQITLRFSILPRSQAVGSYPAKTEASLFFVRDGRIELPLTVWKTVILPLN